MAIKHAVVFDHRTRGRISKYDDFWRLVIHDDTKAFVEHEWKPSASGDDSTQSAGGLSRCSVEDFLLHSRDTERVEKLRKALVEAGFNIQAPK